MTEEFVKYVRVQHIAGHTCAITIPHQIVKQLGIKHHQNLKFHLEGRKLVYDVDVDEGAVL